MWVPSYESTNGDIAAQVGEQVGLVPDVNQRAMLDAMYAERRPGVPACFAVGIIAPRQNIKTATLEIAALTDLFVMGDELIVWTAHLFKTAVKAFEHMVRLIEGNDDFRKRCRKPRTANGDESIELLTGQKIEFHARSKGGGRGLTGDKVILDEGLFLDAGDMGALLPTLVTIPGAQVRYGSSAGMVGSEVLRRVRDRGRAGGDPSLAYFEWCAPRSDCGREDCRHVVGTDGCALDRRDLWWEANPALSVGRITEETLVELRAELPAEEFAREFLGWWEDPALGAEGRLPKALWDTLADVGSQIVSMPEFAVDVTPDLSRATLAAAGGREDGRAHVEVLKNAPGTGWVVPDTMRVTEKAGSRRVALDPTSPAGSLIPALEAAGLDVVAVSTRELGQACGALVNTAATDQLRHIDQHDLNAALAGASTRNLGDGAWAWARKSSATDISPLVAVTLALHGHAVHGNNDDQILW
jgi:hypothetical protein